MHSVNEIGDTSIGGVTGVESNGPWRHYFVFQRFFAWLFETPQRYRNTLSILTVQRVWSFILLPFVEIFPIIPLTV